MAEGKRRVTIVMDEADYATLQAIAREARGGMMTAISACMAAYKHVQESGLTLASVRATSVAHHTPASRQPAAPVEKPAPKPAQKLKPGEALRADPERQARLLANWKANMPEVAHYTDAQWADVMEDICVQLDRGISFTAVKFKFAPPTYTLEESHRLNLEQIARENAREAEADRLHEERAAAARLEQERINAIAAGVADPSALVEQALADLD